MEYNEILVGKTYCIVKKTASGKTVEKVWVKAKIPIMKAVLVVDENKRETMIYQNSLGDLFEERETKKTNKLVETYNTTFQPLIAEGVYNVKMLSHEYIASEKMPYIRFQFVVIDSGKIIAENRFEKGFAVMFSHLKQQLGRENEAIKPQEFFNELIKNETPFKIWVTKRVVNGAPRINFNFLGPIPEVIPDVTVVEDKNRIKQILEERKIKYLVHFTDCKNIESIKAYGILSRKELIDKKLFFTYNDRHRVDQKLDYISLSISKANFFLLNAFRKSGLENPVVIYLDAKLLYEEFDTIRFYCDRNAAANFCEKGKTVDFFENMFKETLSYKTIINEFIYDRVSDRRRSYETTDPQAEILFHKRIDPKYIVEIRRVSFDGSKNMFF